MSYSFHEYQLEAAKFVNPDLSCKDRILSCALGLAGESGEVVDIIKKELFHKKNEDLISEDAYPKLREELGDVLWYVSNLATALCLFLETTAEMNINKLKARHPNGFSPSYHNKSKPTSEETDGC